MDITQGLSIDGTRFMVPFSKMTRKANVLDKYAARTEDGDLKREVIGAYYNFEFEFGYFGDTKEERDLYNRLWDKLTEPTPFHDIEIPADTGTYTMKCYISSVEDQAKKIYKDRVVYEGLKCKFTAKKPARKPS